MTLVWSLGCASWSAALREEHRIKQLRRRDKQALLGGRAASPSKRG